MTFGGGVYFIKQISFLFLGGLLNGGNAVLVADTIKLGDDFFIQIMPKFVHIFGKNRPLTAWQCQCNRVAGCVKIMYINQVGRCRLVFGTLGKQTGDERAFTKPVFTHGKDVVAIGFDVKGGLYGIDGSALPKVVRCGACVRAVGW